MLTQTLEKLILSGKATFKTCVAGGSEKFVLNVSKDRFIIITHLSFQMPTKAGKDIFIKPEDLDKAVRKGNTQMKIFSTKSLNSYLIRPVLNCTLIKPDLFLLLPGGTVETDCYLVHETDVSFTFSNASGLDPSYNLGLTKPESIGYAPPMDYGKEGLPGSIPVTNVAKVVNSTSGNNFVTTGGDLYSRSGQSSPTELIFPIDTKNIYSDLESPFDYPIVNVSYVEIQGSPNNISGTY
jgi:hypothetical protein